MPSPLRKPPEGFRDPSEFEGADEQTNLEKLKEGSAIQKALDEAKKKDAGPEAAWVREQKAEVDDLFNELANLEVMSDDEANARSRISAGKEGITDRLQRRWEEAKKVGDPTAFLAVASEVLRRFKDISGLKELGGGRVIMDIGKTKRFYEHAAALEGFLKNKALQAVHPEEDILASRPPPEETFKAAPPPEQLPGGIKIRRGMGVKIE